MGSLKAFFPKREKDQDNPVIVLSKSPHNYTVSYSEDTSDLAVEMWIRVCHTFSV